MGRADRDRDIGDDLSRMSSHGLSEETLSWSMVPRSFSRTTEKAVETVTMTMRMKAIRPGMRNMALRSSGLYQTRTSVARGMATSVRPRLSSASSVIVWE